jgi:aminopeptidase N
MFGETPVMSPYLLAFAVSDFDYSSLKNGPTLHRIYARPDNDAVLRTQFALKNSDMFLKELERYVALRYELSKVDQIALPDFESGLFMQKLLWKSDICLR